jgi:glycosyltransferase involved in cell wall biosynthesis
VLEAMAARIPVVATAAGGIPEAVRADVDGLLVERPADVDDFAAAVQRMLDDPGLRHRLTENAFARVQETFALDSVCARYRSVLAGAASRRGP